MKVVLDTFARAGIETGLGCDLEAGVRAALRHYTRRSQQARERLLSGPLSTRLSTCAGNEFELDVEPKIRAALEREARRLPGVSVEQLAGHAVLVYLADMDRFSAWRARPLTVR